MRKDSKERRRERQEINDKRHRTPKLISESAKKQFQHVPKY